MPGGSGNRARPASLIPTGQRGNQPYEEEESPRGRSRSRSASPRGRRSRSASPESEYELEEQAPHLIPPSFNTYGQMRRAIADPSGGFRMGQAAPKLKKKISSSSGEWKPARPELFTTDVETSDPLQEAYIPTPEEGGWGYPARVGAPGSLSYQVWEGGAGPGFRAAAERTRLANEAKKAKFVVSQGNVGQGNAGLKTKAEREAAKAGAPGSNLSGVRKPGLLSSVRTVPGGSGGNGGAGRPGIHPGNMPGRYIAPYNAPIGATVTQVSEPTGQAEATRLAFENAARDYHPFPGDTVAPLSEEQILNLQNTEKAALNPSWAKFAGESEDLIRNASSPKYAKKLLKDLKGRILNDPTENAAKYMNPYTKGVIENIQKYGKRNLTENLLPQVNDIFIRGGQYGSTGHQTFANRALRDTQESIDAQTNEALHKGYSQALSTAQQQQQVPLQYGQLHGTIRENEFGRQQAGGEALNKANISEFERHLRGREEANKVGTVYQQAAQTANNAAIEEHNRMQNFPYQQGSRLTEALKGIPQGGGLTYSTATPYQPPQMSGYGQAAGILSGIYGSSGGFGRGYASGGHVNEGHVRPHLRHIRHYADGGQPMSPIQHGVNDALDTAELRMMREQAQQLQAPQRDPFYAGLARAGWTMAGSKAGSTLGALAEAGHAYEDVQEQHAANRHKGIEASSKILDMVANTKHHMQKHQEDLAHKKLTFEKEHELERMKFGETRRHHGALESLKAEKNKDKDNFIKGPDGMLYEQYVDEDGRTKVRPLEGMIPKEGKKSKSVYDKSDEEALKTANKSLETLPVLGERLDKLEELFPKIESGGVLGRNVENPIFGGAAKVGLAATTPGSYSENLTNIDESLMATKNLVLDLQNQLKGNTVAVAKFKALNESKPGLDKTPEANMKSIRLMRELKDMAQEQAELQNYAIKNGYHAVDANSAYNNYLKEKNAYEKANNKPYPASAEEYFELSITEGGTLPISETKGQNAGLSNLSDEEIDRLIKEQR